MGRQWNQIIESLGPLSGGTGLSINANLTEIEALLTTLQADIVDGIIVSSGSSVVTNGTLAQLTNGTVTANIDSSSFVTALNSFGQAYSAQVPVGIDQSGFGDVPITGSVTSQPVRGTTTTGTLTAGTTNGTLFAAKANRNYLLVQCTSGTVFIDTNGTASATDDIQLTSGQGITWEGSFIPTGAIAAITSTGTARIVGIQG